jgi:TPP-dependent indolepyruvate ferredoxin oxidoreductase alpha subunit
VLTGNEALARALGASRLRVSHGFVGVPLHRFVDGMAARPPAGLSHHPSSSDLRAAGLALGGALLTGAGTCLVLRAGGVNVALEALATLGLLNELSAPTIVIAGVDPGPASAATAQDDRSTLAHVCHLPQLDPGSPAELYHYTRLAVQASRRGGLPVVVRVGSRALDATGPVQETPADAAPDAGPLAFSRAGGPYLISSSTYRYHVDKRARRLAQLEGLATALCVRTGEGGPAGVVLAGHLGPRTQAKIAARRIPTLRLGTAWPLPRQQLENFLADKREVLVLEEGEAFIEHALQAMAHRAGIACRVRGLDDRRPQRLDEDRLENAMRRMGAVIDDPSPVDRDSSAYTAATESIGTLAPIDIEPWPLYLARTRKKLWGFSSHDPRARLLEGIRALPRPTMVVADPSAAALLGFRERFIDVKAGFGLAPSVAGALSEAVEIEEAQGKPLAVALIGDLNVFQSSLLGIIDNVAQQREVLHVILAREHESLAPGLSAAGASAASLIEAQLRALGLPYLVATLKGDDALEALRTIAAESGPRALLYVGAPGREDAIGG